MPSVARKRGTVACKVIIEKLAQELTDGIIPTKEDAKLRLGLAQIGKDRAKGVRTLQSVKGNDGTADVARLWTLVGG